MSVSSELGELHECSLSAGMIRFRERGAGQPLVFVHGLLVNGDLWRKIVPELAASHRCLTPDWPLGSHERPMEPNADLSIEGLARLIAEFLEALDLREVVLVANDTGGAIVQVLMTTAPERLAGVVLTPCDSFENFLPKMFHSLQWLADKPRLLAAWLQVLRIRRAHRLPFAYGWLAKRPFPKEIVASYVSPVLRRAEVRRDLGKVLRSISPALTVAAAEKLPAFHLPVLVAWASEDRIFPPEHARALADRLPKAQLEYIDDTYAFIPEDRPEVLIMKILQFLPALRAAR